MITRIVAMLIALLLSQCSIILAQTTTTSSPSSGTVTPTIDKGEGSYTYAGCYNETTLVAGSGGARALVGTMVLLIDMRELDQWDADCEL
jgi:hypothetical protein